MEEVKEESRRRGERGRRKVEKETGKEGTKKNGRGNRSKKRKN